MIRIELQRIGNQDLFCPRFYCDACGEAIKQNADGNYLWYYAIDDKAAQQVYTAHKGQCTDALDSEYATGAKLPMSWELKDLPAELATNGEVNQC